MTDSWVPAMQTEYMQLLQLEHRLHAVPAGGDTSA
jgi:hypothetical protein